MNLLNKRDVKKSYRYEANNEGVRIAGLDKGSVIKTWKFLSVSLEYRLKSDLTNLQLKKKNQWLTYLTFGRRLSVRSKPCLTSYPTDVIEQKMGSMLEAFGNSDSVILSHRIADSWRHWWGRSAFYLVLCCDSLYFLFLTLSVSVSAFFLFPFSLFIEGIKDPKRRLVHCRAVELINWENDYPVFVSWKAEIFKKKLSFFSCFRM